MADRKLAPKDKRVLVRFLQRSKADADVAAGGDDQAAAAESAVDASAAANDTRPFVEALEQDFKLSPSLHRLVTNAMAWTGPNAPVSTQETTCK